MPYYDDPELQKIFADFSLWNDIKKDMFLIDNYPKKFFQRLLSFICKFKKFSIDEDISNFEFISLESLDFFVPIYKDKNKIQILVPVKLFNTLANEGYYKRIINDISVTTKYSAFIVVFCVLVTYIFMFVSGVENKILNPYISKEEKLDYLYNGAFFQFVLKQIFDQSIDDNRFFMKNDIQLQKFKLVNQLIKQSKQEDVDMKDLIDEYIINNPNIELGKGNGSLKFIQQIFARVVFSLTTMLLKPLKYRHCQKRNFEVANNNQEFLIQFLECFRKKKDIKTKLEILNSELSAQNFSFGFIFDSYVKFLGFDIIYLEYELSNKFNNAKFGVTYKFTSISSIDLLSGAFDNFSFFKYQNPFLFVNNCQLLDVDTALKIFGGKRDNLPWDAAYLLPNSLNSTNNSFVVVNQEGNILDPEINIGTRKMKFGRDIVFSAGGKTLSYQICGIVYSDNKNKDKKIVFSDKTILPSELLFLYINYFIDGRQLTNQFLKMKILFQKNNSKGNFANNDPNGILWKYEHESGYIPIYLFYFCPEIINNIKYEQ